MQILSLDHFVLTCRDVEKTVVFYRDGLGMRHTVTNGRHALFYGNQKINLHATKAEFLPAAASPEYGSADFCLTATGPIEAIVEEIRGKGLPIVAGPVGRNGARGPMQSVYVRDPDGNLVEIAVY